MSAETETIRFLGGENELQEPAEASGHLLTAIDTMLAAIKAEAPPNDETLATFATLMAAADPDITRDKLRERMDDVRIHLGHCREEYKDATTAHENVEVGYDKVRESSFKAPRNLKLYARYRAPNGNTVSFECAPRDVAIHKLPYQLRNLIQRCAIG